MARRPVYNLNFGNKKRQSKLTKISGMWMTKILTLIQIQTSDIVVLIVMRLWAVCELSWVFIIGAMLFWSKHIQQKPGLNYFELFEPLWTFFSLNLLQSIMKWTLYSVYITCSGRKLGWHAEHFCTLWITNEPCFAIGELYAFDLCPPGMVQNVQSKTMKTSMKHRMLPKPAILEICPFFVERGQKRITSYEIITIRFFRANNNYDLFFGHKQESPLSVQRGVLKIILNNGNH